MTRPSAKGLLVRSLARIARVTDPLTQRAGRAWAHARFTARAGQPIDPSTVVLGVPEIHGTARLRLGRNLYLYPHLYLETEETGFIAIGDDVVLSRGVHIVSYAGITIGDGTMIGEYTSIRDANHRTTPGAALRTAGHRAAPIAIGAHVWIGRGVAVLPGVTIGDRAVIGANAVVTRSVPAGAVAIGMPARPRVEVGQP